jgi:hypothetical protein
MTLAVTCLPSGAKRNSVFARTATVFPSGPCDGHDHLWSSVPLVVNWNLLAPSGDESQRLLPSMYATLATPAGAAASAVIAAAATSAAVVCEPSGKGKPSCGEKPAS